MLSYRHSFHAGNHADVLKHIVQSLILTAMKEKDKPFLYLDTHAGTGRYQLHSEHAERTGEYQDGIGKIWQRDDCPALLEPYLTVIRHYNRNGTLRYYPGSPLIARQMLREQDRLHLTELHSSDYPLLKSEFQKDRRADVLRADGYQQLKSQLPPLSRRGVILMDPPYELKSDYQDVVTAIHEGYKRFATGVYALWYPVVLRQHVKRILAGPYIANRTGDASGQRPARHDRIGYDSDQSSLDAGTADERTAALAASGAGAQRHRPYVGSLGST